MSTPDVGPALEAADHATAIVAALGSIAGSIIAATTGASVFFWTRGRSYERARIAQEKSHERENIERAKSDAERETRSMTRHAALVLRIEQVEARQESLETNICEVDERVDKLLDEIKTVAKGTDIVRLEGQITGANDRLDRIYDHLIAR